MSTRMTRPLLLVGCGKMGGAMLSGWLESGIAAGGVTIVDPAGAPDFAGRDGVTILTDGADVPNDLNPEVVVLAVKPQQMANVLGAWKRFAAGDCLFISVAAGTTIAFFEATLGGDAAIIRAMPNTPAAIGQGVTVICPNAKASEAQAALAMALLQAVGDVHRVDDEALIDAVTGVSGSGPAYVFLMIECMTEAGIEAGLPPDLAGKLALATVSGAGQLAKQSGIDPATLRQNVTSPAGTTYEALQVLMAEDGLQPLMTRAVAAATRRSRELAG